MYKPSCVVMGQNRHTPFSAKLSASEEALDTIANPAKKTGFIIPIGTDHSLSGLNKQTRWKGKVVRFSLSCWPTWSIGLLG